MGLVDGAPADEVRELLQSLIRNACINDGTGGHETANAETLRAHLDGHGIDVATYEPAHGRTSLVARIEGTDPDAPTIALMGHTDVVPVTPGAWSRDPFAGELVDGEVWGRGAIDMLNLTAAMSVAATRLADDRPRATTLFLAVADEEAGGLLGAGWLTEHAWDAVEADVVLTEAGGIVTPTPGGRVVVMGAAEKGVAARRLTIRGRSSHGSRPYGADNAVVRAAEVVRRLASHRGGAVITQAWREWVRGYGWDRETEELLLDPARVLDAIDAWDDPESRAIGHAMTHTTFSPNVLHGGTRTNVVPDEVVLSVDIRTLPGTSSADVDVMLGDLLGDLGDIRWEPDEFEREASQSRTDNRWWDLLSELAVEAHPEATVLPRTSVGGTDAPWFRRRGVPAYGAGLFGPDLDLATFSARFHGPDERVDVASLGLSAAFYEQFVRRA